MNTFISSARATQNFGGGAYLYVGGGNPGSSSTSYGGANLYSLVQLPITTLASTETILHAELWYYVRSAGTDMFLHEMASYWSESSTFTDFGLPFASSTIGTRLGRAPGTLGWHRVNVTSALRAWHATSRPNHGFIFVSAGSGSYTTMRGRGDLRSGLNCCPPTYAPRLEVTITPGRGPAPPSASPPPQATVFPPGLPRPSPPPPHSPSPPAAPSLPPAFLNAPRPPPPIAGTITFTSGCESTTIRQAFPDVDFSGDAMHSWDGAYYGGRNVALLRFSNILGHGPGLIAPHHIIVAATLRYKVAVQGADADWHEATVPWSSPGATWTTFVGTTGLDDELGPLVGSVDYTQHTVRLDRPGTWHSVDVRSSLIRYQSGVAMNYGWAKVATGEHGGTFYGCNVLNSADAPRLEVHLAETPPAPPMPPPAPSPAPKPPPSPPPPPARPLTAVTISGSPAAQDTYISSATSNRARNYALEGRLRWDGQISSSSGGQYAVLMKFDLTTALVGMHAQNVEHATLNYHVLTTRAGPPAEMHELLVPWSDTTVTHDSLPFNSASWGPSVNEATGLTSNCNVCGWNAVDVTESVRRWMASPSTNHGWIFLPTGTSEVDVEDSESPTNAPTLIVHVAPPEPPSAPPSPPMPTPPPLPTPPVPAPPVVASPAPPGAAIVPAVQFDAVMSGSINDFDEAAYISGVSSLTGAPTDAISVITSGTGRRLQAGLTYTVSTTIVVPPTATIQATAVQAAVTTGFQGMATGLGLTVTSFTAPVIATSVLFSPPPAPAPLAAVTNSTGSNLVIANPGASAMTAEGGGGNTTTYLVIIAVLVVLFVSVTGFLVRRHIKNRATSTIVKAVPVTAITNPIAEEVSTTSAGAIQLDIEGDNGDDETKL